MLEQSQVSDFIQKHELLAPGQPVLAAVSGGADSLCLAWLLRQLDYPLRLAHLDHGLRPESRQEADYVRSLAEQWSVPFFSETAQPPAPGVGSIEAWARQARYAFLLRIATREDIAVVATGHTADDQVETILMNLMRGSGPAGLAGMEAKGELPVQGASEQRVSLVRPLLGLWRQQTEAVCRRAGLTPQQDASNMDLSFTRNRIRHSLLPALAEFNPSIKEALQRTGLLMGLIQDWMEQESDAAWESAVARVAPGGVFLNREFFNGAPDALALSLIRRVHSQLTDYQAEIDLEHSLAALETLKEGHRGQRLSLPGDLTLEIVGEEAVLSADVDRQLRHQAPQVSGPMVFQVGEELALGGGWRLKGELTDPSQWELDPTQSVDDTSPLHSTEAMGWLDEAKHIQLRPPAPGDSFQPLGMQGTMKLADFFINEGVAQAQRAGWPLLVVDDVIMWVVGLRLAEAARVTPSHQKILRLELKTPASVSPA